MFTGDIMSQIPSSTEFNGKTDKVQGLVEVAQSLLSKKGNFQTLPAEKNKSQITIIIFIIICLKNYK